MEFSRNNMLGPTVAFPFVMLAGLTSFITAAFGACGGLLLVVMASL